MASERSSRLSTGAAVGMLLALLAAVLLAGCGSSRQNASASVPDTSSYQLFRASAGRLPAALQGAHVKGIQRVLDDGSRAGVDALADLMATPSGTEVCVLLRSARAPAGSASAHLGGTCGGPSRTAAHHLYLSYGDTQLVDGRVRDSRLAGLVPDGISRVTLTFADRRTLTVPVVDNAIAAQIPGRVVSERCTPRAC